VIRIEKVAGDVGSEIELTAKAAFKEGGDLVTGGGGAPSYTYRGEPEVERYLSGRLGPLEVRRVRRSYPGHSRETLLVATAGESP
jgi:hypothetical protein